MIAEEVGEVLPEIVEYEENGVDATGNGLQQAHAAARGGCEGPGRREPEAEGAARGFGRAHRRRRDDGGRERLRTLRGERRRLAV